ncbi:MAG: hypothetical protein HN919_12730 [Verrucomicrobia bacterium]|nr:hypothetical protein [Verrucomicrobiota bacterium]MBT7067164.1 hypothetical protein [Verrucomicrobiota bacterium]MBT7701700.1 hypothetical protein [Verrucomicrobiota bacterium]
MGRRQFESPVMTELSADLVAIGGQSLASALRVEIEALNIYDFQEYLRVGLWRQEVCKKKVGQS